MQNVGQGPKFFVVDNLSELMNLTHYASFVTKIADDMTAINGVFVSSVNTDALQKLYEKNISQEWITKVNTSFIFPSEVSVVGVDKVLSLGQAELQKLSGLSVSSRMFLIKQDGKTIASELSIGGLPGLTRLFCSGRDEREIYKEVVKEFGDEKPDNWVQEFYEELENKV